MKVPSIFFPVARCNTNCHQNHRIRLLVVAIIGHMKGVIYLYIFRKIQPDKILSLQSLALCQQFSSFIMKDSSFSNSNENFKPAIAELKRIGLGDVEHYPSINEADRKKLYTSMFLSPNTRNLFIYLSKDPT
jgi:hypothetical protein